MSKSDYEGGYNAGFQAGYQEARARYEQQLKCEQARYKELLKQVTALAVERTERDLQQVESPSVEIKRAAVYDAAMYGIGMWQIKHVPVEKVLETQKAKLSHAPDCKCLVCLDEARRAKCTNTSFCRLPGQCANGCKLDALDRACDY